ncbi:MAG: exonuclease, partial [Proteobacteria bacterium]
MELHRPWTECTFIAFDTETSGAYPIGSEIIEFGAVKWKDGQEVGTFQTLLKPRELLN